MSHRVVVAILNYNGRKHLETYIPSVIQHTPLDIARIVIIDNGSKDDSLVWLDTHYSDVVEVIKLPKNLGFAGGYNEGLKQLNAVYFVLLSSDVRVSQDWLAPMLELMDANPKIAVCQPKILSDIEKQQFDYSGANGGWIDKHGIPFAMGRIFKHIEKDRHQYDAKTSNIFWACGAALMIRKDAYNAVNGMYPYLFAHQEEIDMCWRLSSLGYIISNCPSSKVYHLGGGTLSPQSPFKIYLNIRNNLIILYKNLPKWTFIRILLFRIILDHTFALIEVLKGNFARSKSIFRAYFSFTLWLFFYKKDKKYFSSHKGWPKYGYYSKSIVFDYYIKKIRKFSDLNI